MLPASPSHTSLLESLGFRTVLNVHLAQVFLGADPMVDTPQNLTLTLHIPWLGPDFDPNAVISLSFLRCLTPDAEARPDIVEVSSMISDVMMKYLDNLSTSQLALERKLDRERRRTQRYFMEANRNAVTCHRELAMLPHVSGNPSISSGYILTGCLKLLLLLLKKILFFFFFQIRTTSVTQVAAVTMLGP